MNARMIEGVMQGCGTCLGVLIAAHKFYERSLLSIEPQCTATCRVELAFVKRSIAASVRAVLTDHLSLLQRASYESDLLFY